jgi:hypothetical protein
MSRGKPRYQRRLLGIIGNGFDRQKVLNNRIVSNLLEMLEELMRKHHKNLLRAIREEVRKPVTRRRIQKAFGRVLTGLPKGTPAGAVKG